ncbi:uncharacterized protein MKK02DRAFT_42371 [Dioszegia hungarica]|uniref:Uncharacterized protein n=1 Tax=Dioszegia hungarica TaxID=4972 RepID=A0AA38HB97_9TREE|nr:uncharacterized protein MKK02DRAFT_42371 [Dioszegia hungarica]KAI9637988.1 hypothetical protein MKK02DRAFT_42371 [Dioszegia hungarica]
MSSTHTASATQAELEYLVYSVLTCRRQFIHLVGHLLGELRASRASRASSATTISMDLHEHIGGALQASAATSSPGAYHTPPKSPSKPTTLLDMIAAETSPGCKRKRSITHIGSISIASITPSAKSALDISCSTIYSGTLAKGAGDGRKVVTRKRIGLGRLFKGLGVQGGCVDADGASDGSGSGSGNGSQEDEKMQDESDEDSDSDDDDLVVIISG